MFPNVSMVSSVVAMDDESYCNMVHFEDMPFAASNPHFYGRYPNTLTSKLDGLHPNKDIHKSYIIVEPTLGVPIDQCARSQSNVIIPNLIEFGPEFERFSEMALPTFWIEYVCIEIKKLRPIMFSLFVFTFQHQKELTTKINVLMVFTIQVLPILQYVITLLLIIFGTGLILQSISNLMDRKLNMRKYPVTKASHKHQLNDDVTQHNGHLLHHNGYFVHQNIPSSQTGVAIGWRC